MNEGWGVPRRALGERKCHYYADGESLCGQAIFYRGPLELGNDDSPDNCARCMKRLAKRPKAEGAGDEG